MSDLLGVKPKHLLLSRAGHSCQLLPNGHLVIIDLFNDLLRSAWIQHYLGADVDRASRVPQDATSARFPTSFHCLARWLLQGVAFKRFYGGIVHYRIVCLS